jgi:F-type H+-transporting ATPase subunit delta
VITHPRGSGVKEAARVLLGAIILKIQALVLWAAGSRRLGAPIERGTVAATDDTVSGVPGRYGGALFELAQETDSVEEISAGLNRFQALLDESVDLRRLVRSPVFSADDQLAALDAICAKADIGGLALNFIRLVTRNRRLFAITDMIKAYRTLIARAKGEVSAEVTSAEPLDRKHVEALKAAIKSAIGRDVDLAIKIDPAILGGLIVKAGSRMVDNSLKTELQNLRIAMKGTG